MIKLDRYIDVSEYKSLLCLHGELPEAPILRSLRLPIISADGATNTLHKQGIVPDLVIGDLDSVGETLLSRVRYKRLIDQQYSDFQKALQYMGNNSLMPAIICGISGGYIDHVINNINIFMQSANCIILTDDIIGYRLVSNHTYKFPVGSKISIIGVPECEITTIGLKWELNNFKSSYPGNNSCFNRVTREPLQIIIHSGKALMLVYLNEIVDAGLLT